MKRKVASRQRGEWQTVTSDQIIDADRIGTPDSCTCATCQGFCTHKPGWFAPSEPERVAEYLGLSLAELFRTKLAVDWWERGDDPIFVIAPAITTSPAGEEYPGNPQGSCIFYEHGLCAIHAVKPTECREAFHVPHKEGSALHMEIADQWDTEEQQQAIRTLLGREPITQPYSIFDWLGAF
jgi:Fe-S-cluster containining protein